MCTDLEGDHSEVKNLLDRITQMSVGGSMERDGYGIGDIRDSKGSVRGREGLSNPLDDVVSGLTVQSKEGLWRCAGGHGGKQRDEGREDDQSDTKPHGNTPKGQREGKSQRDRASGGILPRVGCLLNSTDHPSVQS